MLGQCFSDLKVHTRLLGLVNKKVWFSRSGWGWSICTSNSFPGATEPAEPRPHTDGQGSRLDLLSFPGDCVSGTLRFTRILKFKQLILFKIFSSSYRFSPMFFITFFMWPLFLGISNLNTIPSQNDPPVLRRKGYSTTVLMMSSFPNFAPKSVFALDHSLARAVYTLLGHFINSDYITSLLYTIWLSIKKADGLYRNALGLGITQKKNS